MATKQSHPMFGASGAGRWARVLTLFEHLHGEALPYYLRRYKNLRERWLTEESRRSVEQERARYSMLTGRLETVGTRIPALNDASESEQSESESESVPSTASLDPDHYYRLLIADGYLDIAIIGGNGARFGAATWCAALAVRLRASGATLDA